MKSALSALAMLGAAGGLGVALPSAHAPQRIGIAEFAGEGVSAAQVITYAARQSMALEDVMTWAEGVPPARDGTRVLLLYAPGHPVPDPSDAESLSEALWIVETKPLRWGVRIDPDGTRAIWPVHAQAGSDHPSDRKAPDGWPYTGEPLRPPVGDASSI